MIDKKEIKKNYKQTLTPMGIYQIKNLVNGKIFIGSGKNLTGKINKHKFELENNSGQILEMQKDYNQFGEKNFSFEVVDYLEQKDDPSYNYTEDLLTLEKLWLEKLKPYGEKGYNK
jgi:group I intron endonuclease